MQQEEINAVCKFVINNNGSFDYGVAKSAVMGPMSFHVRIMCILKHFLVKIVGGMKGYISLGKCSNDKLIS